MKATRRGFLGVLGGLAATPALASRKKAAAPLPRTEVDVVVIGAGAAGIAAARRLLAAKRSVLVVEARDRVGGRAETDTALFNRPVDLGAHWLHDAANNSLVALARSAGIVTQTAPDGRLDMGGRFATEAELTAYDAALDAATQAIEAAAAEGRDVAAAGVVPDGGDWRETVAFSLGPYDSGVDLDDLSTVDFANGAEGEDFFATGGYGALVAGLAEGLPITLSTLVTTIDWSGKGVRIDSAAGIIEAKAAIITASTNALMAERIVFKPALPDPTLSALAALPLATYNHIILEIPGDPLGFGPDAEITFRIEDPNALGLLANIGGGPLWYCDVAGRFGKELEEESDLVAGDWAKDFLARRFGRALVPPSVRVAVTHWGLEPTILGAFSAAVPGGAARRLDLARPLGDRLYFAGEATSVTAFGTVHGAWLEGERAAAAVLARLA
ncbi:MAG: flavin monoamine oxidase family protein [Labrys sp. (in: a-proteobacteria)]